MDEKRKESHLFENQYFDDGAKGHFLNKLQINIQVFLSNKIGTLTLNNIHIR